ncbi:MAG TPA: hypothetical protein PLS73_12155 [Saprospiraceae bacterium]|nr:hypothetical protein [Saprospiraceae bacterium]
MNVIYGYIKPEYPLLLRLGTKHPNVHFIHASYEFGGFTTAG